MRFLFGFILVLLLLSCTTGPDLKGPHSDVGVWEGKVLMTSLKSKQKKWAYLTWASDSASDRMRINVSAVMNYPVATFLKNKDRNQLWLFTENKHFVSDRGERLFFHLTKLSMDPRIFYSLLGNPRSPGEGWDCQKEENRLSCHSAETKTHFSVEYGQRDERKIKVIKDGKALQIRLSRSKVQVSDKLFQPLSTSQFKTIEI